MSETALYVISVGILTAASYYRTVTINEIGYQKQEDAYFPIYRGDESTIGRELVGTKIIRERTIWECIAILVVRNYLK